jgi:HlyD family secretion protein
MMFGFLRNRRLWWIILVVGALATVAVWPRAIEVETATIARGPLVVTIDEDGRTRVRDRFVVTAPVSGEVRRIELRPGDRVKKGTRLAVIRPAAPTPLDARSRAEAEAAMRSSESALGRVTADRARAAAALEFARRQLKRVETLATGGAVAREEVDQRDTDVRAAEEVSHAAEYAVAQAQHDAEVARARLAPTGPEGAQRDWVITAPVDGVVLTQYHESEGVVPAGERLLEIGDPSRLEIVADLLSTDAVKISAGSAVLIEQWGGPSTLHGRVRRIEPAGYTKVSALGVEEQRVNVVIDFDLPSGTAATLGDNFRVEVRVIVWQADAVLTVSPGSLFRQGNEWALFVLEGGRAHARTVVIGARSGTAAQVLSGVDDGAAVVVYPPDTLHDDSRVTVRQQR